MTTAGTGRVKTPYDAVAISGGAARGAAFLGVLHRLQQGGDLDHVKTVSGTSIGALAAVLLAKKCNMVEALATISRRPFDVEADLFSLEPPFGLNSGVEMMTFIRTLVGRQTFGALHAATGVDVVVCATSLRKKRPVYFRSATHADMDVAWAVRLSCTLPLLFGYGEHGGDAFVDGGLTDNFPTNPLTQAGCQNILGLRFKAPDPRRLPQELTAYVIDLMTCVAWQAKPEDGACRHVIELDVPQEASFDFSMSPAMLQGLFDLGYDSCS